MDAIEKQLEKDGIGLILLRRPEDAAGLDYATKGFFKFWSGIKKGECLSAG